VRSHQEVKILRLIRRKITKVNFQIFQIKETPEVVLGITISARIMAMAMAMEIIVAIAREAKALIEVAILRTEAIEIEAKVKAIVVTTRVIILTPTTTSVFKTNLFKIPSLKISKEAMTAKTGMLLSSL